MWLTALIYTFFSGAEARQALDEGAEQFSRMQLDCTGRTPAPEWWSRFGSAGAANRQITNGAI